MEGRRMEALSLYLTVCDYFYISSSGMVYCEFVRTIWNLNTKSARNSRIRSKSAEKSDEKVWNAFKFRS